MTIQTTLRQGLAAAQDEWRGSQRLRLGVWIVLAILWAYGLIAGSDHLAAGWQRVSAAQAEIDRLRAVSRQVIWPAREDEVRRHAQALEAMLWPARSRGAAEAALLDLLKDRATRAKLLVRELQIAGVGGVGPAGPPSREVAPSAGAQVLRATLVVDFDRLPLLALLSELARNDQVVVVERVQVRTLGSTPRAEIGVRVLYREKAVGT
jgi:hypothetical protein